MKAVCSAEMSVNFYRSTWCHIPETKILPSHDRYKLASHTFVRIEYILLLMTPKRTSSLIMKMAVHEVNLVFCVFICDVKMGA
jgi:hypothetical protein